MYDSNITDKTVVTRMVSDGVFKILALMQNDVFDVNPYFMQILCAFKSLN